MRQAHGTRITMRRNLITEARIECEEYGPKNLADCAPVCRARPAFEQAVMCLVPWTNSRAPGHRKFPGVHRCLVDLFAGRAQYGAIQGWRFGRRNPPDWAIDMLAQRLEDEASQRLAAARLLRESKKPAPTRTGLKK
jgi:hypothetical protein